MSNRHKVFVSYHHARDEEEQPDNSRASFGKNRTGAEWTD